VEDLHDVVGIGVDVLGLRALEQTLYVLADFAKLLRRLQVAKLGSQ
jgi:hypothetical protein